MFSIERRDIGAYDDKRYNLIETDDEKIGSIFGFNDNFITKATSAMKWTRCLGKLIAIAVLTDRQPVLVIRSDRWSIENFVPIDLLRRVEQRHNVRVIVALDPDGQLSNDEIDERYPELISQTAEVQETTPNFAEGPDGIPHRPTRSVAECWGDAEHRPLFADLEETTSVFSAFQEPSFDEVSGEVEAIPVDNYDGYFIVANAPAAYIIRAHNNEFVAVAVATKFTQASPPHRPLTEEERGLAIKIGFSVEDETLPF